VQQSSPLNQDRAADGKVGYFLIAKEQLEKMKILQLLRSIAVEVFLRKKMKIFPQGANQLNQLL